METPSTALSTDAIPRLAEHVDDNALYLSLSMRVLTTHWNPTLAEAYVPLSGMDNLKRFQEPIKLFNRYRSVKFLIVGRAQKDEVKFHRLDADGLVRHCGLRRSRIGDVITSDHVNHTGDQVQWSMNVARSFGAKSVAIFTEAYHLFRSFATAVQTLGPDESNWIPILPIATGQLDDPVDELTKKGIPCYGYDLVPNEVSRYFKYSAEDRINPLTGMPDVASLERVNRYLNWMRSTHPHLYR